jgi:uncharacterized protein YlxP (DUF503 family)
MASKVSPIAAGALIELHLPAAQSLKDKRQVVKSLIQRLKNRYNISIIEAGQLDLWQRAGFALVFFALSQTEAVQSLAKIKNFIEQVTEAEIIKYETFYFHPEKDA